MHYNLEVDACVRKPGFINVIFFSRSVTRSCIKLSITRYCRINKSSRQCMNIDVNNNLIVDIVLVFDDTLAQSLGNLLLRYVPRIRLPDQIFIWPTKKSNSPTTCTRNFMGYMQFTLFVLGMVGCNQLGVRREFALMSYMVRLLRGIEYNLRVLQQLHLYVHDRYVWRRRPLPLLVVPSARIILLAKTPLFRAICTINYIQV